MKRISSIEEIALNIDEKSVIRASSFKIAVMVEETGSFYAREILNGIFSVCSDLPVDIYIFTGRALNSPVGQNKRYNTIYQLITSAGFNAVIALTSQLAKHISQNDLLSFIRTYKNIPFVSVGHDVSGVSNILIDNYTGMKNLVSHIIEAHQRTKIAFISGGTATDARIRYQAYCDSLEEHAINIDKNYIFNGDYYYTSGEIAVKQLLKSKIVCNAIVAANDSMALGALYELQNSGFVVPDDYIVTGFDNSDESLLGTPSLTTISQPTYELGKSAIIAALRRCLGKSEIENIILASEPVIRQSCGCDAQAYIKTLNFSESVEPQLEDENIISKQLDLLQNIPLPIVYSVKASVDELDYLLPIKNVNQPVQPDKVKTIFSKMILVSKDLDIDFSSWYTIIQLVEKVFISQIDEKNDRLQYRSMFQQVRAMIADISLNKVVKEYYSVLTFNNKLREINEHLMLNYDMEYIKEIIAQKLPTIDVFSAYIILYNHIDKQHGVAKEATLFFNMTNKVLKTDKDIIFKTKKVLPAVIANRQKNNIFYITPLFYKEDDYGYIIYKHTSKQLALYDSFTIQVSSVLRLYYTYQKRTVSEKKLKLILQNSKEINNALTDTLTTLADTREKLVEAEKLASLGSLVAGIAHEVNTPLGTTLLTTSYLIELAKKYRGEFTNNALTKNDFEKYLKQNVETGTLILKNLIKASDLITNFKQIAVDQTSFEIREFELNDYLNGIVRSMKSLLKKTTHTLQIVSDEKIVLVGYPGALSQVVSNLITNALMHGFEHIDNGKITIQYTTMAEKLKLSISDNGCGIAPDHLKQIYSPFFTTKKDQGGSGLGLQISYNLVTQKMGGRIDCVSSLRKGATFTIVIPLKIKVKHDS